jgi:hypothetical protein
MTTASGADGAPSCSPADISPVGSIARRSGRDGASDDPAADRLSDQQDVTPRQGKLKTYFGPDGLLRPFRLFRQDLVNLKGRWISDWTVFNQQVVASAVYIFFTNILPGLTFASDLYSLTGKSWGTIEIVFSTGLCGIIFAT